MEFNHYTVIELCRLFGVSKQAYYKSSDRGFKRGVLVSFVLEYVRLVRESAPGIGGEKLWLMYKDFFGQQYSIGRDAFLTVLRANGLLLGKGKKSTKTTDSRHDYPVYPDLVKDLLITRPNQVWVSDITYVNTLQGFCFLFLVTDAYTRQIIGRAVAPGLGSCYALEALNMASDHLSAGKVVDLIHHSDRGMQYACIEYITRLKDLGIQVSMTQSGNPKDNAIAERVNGILKREFLNPHSFRDIEHLKQVVDISVTFYNNQRPHRSLDMKTPSQAALLTGIIKKKWRCYKDQYRYVQNNTTFAMTQKDF